jgi:hypothetical protein
MIKRQQADRALCAETTKGSRLAQLKKVGCGWAFRGWLSMGLVLLQHYAVEVAGYEPHRALALCRGGG